jgi:ubiquinone/menaquinone biosynthesis C-methylase UbiE
MREHNPNAVFHGCDIDPEAIGWCAKTLGDLATFRVNGHSPPLPFVDESFDFIYSISIFTHLPEDMQFAWLKDLNRVLKPGGTLLTTVLNPFAYALPAQVTEAAKATGFAYFDNADETSGLPSFYRLAYHTHDYVDRKWSEFFEVVAKGHSDLNNTQDSVLCVKRQ